MKKFISLLVVAAFALSFLPVAKADTVSDLNAQIATLQAQITSLQGDTSIVHFCFYTNLKFGMKSDDIKLMQEKLGVINTGYFGYLTLAAVNSFQIKYRSEILDPLGLTSATGFVGAATRAKLNTLYCGGAAPGGVTVYPAGCTSAAGFSVTTGLSCAAAYPAGCTSAAGFSITTGYPCSTAITYPAGCTSAVGFSPTTGVSCATGTTVTTVAGAPTEGFVQVTSAPVAVNGTLYGGDTNKTVYAFSVQAKNSDMSLKKVDVRLYTTNGTLYFPWKSFSGISLYDGATKIASLPITSTSLIETTFGVDYTARFDGLNIAIAKDAIHNFSVTMDVLNTPSDYVTGHVGLVTQNAIRTTDSLGLTQYDISGQDPIATAITLIPENNTTNLTATADVSNPVNGTVKVSATSETDGVIALMFDVKNSNTYNATVRNIVVGLTDASGIADVSAVQLWDSSLMVSNKNASATVTFDNLNIVIAAGATKVFTVKLNFVANANDDVTVSHVSTNAIDSNYNTISAVAGFAGAILTPSVNATIVSFVSGTNVVTTPTSGSAYATGTITFTVQSNGTTLPVFTASTTGGTNIIQMVAVDSSNGSTTNVTTTILGITGQPAQYGDGATPSQITVSAIAHAASKGVYFMIASVNGVTAYGDTAKFVTPTQYLP